ncbi:hypothetical protein A4G18_01335 [Pasteurellaceae bacterium Pebbles2]|nr:hypothetical protein [Pasteurellaceae bacterium Pebbles2]
MKILLAIFSLFLGFTNLSYASEYYKTYTNEELNNINITVLNKTYNIRDFDPDKNKNYFSEVKKLESKAKSLLNKTEKERRAKRQFPPNELDKLIIERNNLIKEIFAKKVISRNLNNYIGDTLVIQIDLIKLNIANKDYINHFEKRTVEIIRFLGLTSNYYFDEKPGQY